MTKRNSMVGSRRWTSSICTCNCNNWQSLRALIYIIRIPALPDYSWFYYYFYNPSPLLPSSSLLPFNSIKHRGTILEWEIGRWCSGGCLGNCIIGFLEFFQLINLNCLPQSSVDGECWYRSTITNRDSTLVCKQTESSLVDLICESLCACLCTWRAFRSSPT